MGDFNADQNKGAFWPLLNEFIESNSFIINDFSLPIDTFTYLSPAHNSTSWLDHIISTSDLNISNISIKYDISLYDHFPLCADISIPVNTGQLPSFCTLISDFIDWPKFNQAAADDFNSKLRILLNDVRVYDVLIDSLKESTRPYTCVRTKKFVTAPGWNAYCKEAYGKAREAFLIWLEDGKIRQEVLYDRMKQTRNRFKNALSYCKRIRQSIKDEILATSVQNKRYDDFWKQVRSRKPCCTQTDREIDGKKSSTDIAALFADKFSAVNGRNDDVTQDNHINDTENIENIWVKRMSYKDVATGIRKLKIGIGYDGVQSNTQSLLIGIL